MAYKRLLLVRLAARVYRAQTGAWPKVWQELVDRKLLEPETIRVPGTGETFRLRTLSDGRPEAYYLEQTGDKAAAPQEVRLEPLTNQK